MENHSELLLRTALEGGELIIIPLPETVPYLFVVYFTTLSVA
jgi:hypothetical protein